MAVMNPIARGVHDVLVSLDLPCRFEFRMFDWRNEIEVDTDASVDTLVEILRGALPTALPVKNIVRGTIRIEGLHPRDLLWGWTFIVRTGK